MVQRLRRLLGRRSARRDERAYVVEGSTLVEEALRAKADVEAIYVAADGPRFDEAKVPVHSLAPGVIERVATTRHAQPALAVVRIPDPVSGALDAARFVVALWDIADPGNLGTILRSAEAAGVDLVVVSEGSVDPYNPKVVRAAAGALFHVPVLIASGLDPVRHAGLRLVGTSSHEGVAYTDADLDGRLALVFGNEAHGLPPDTGVERWVRIPHAGRAESLNVAMAATLIIFEVARGRLRGGDRRAPE